MKQPKVLGPTILTGTSEIDVGGTGARLEAPVNGSILAIKIEMSRAGVPTTAESDMVVVRLKSNTIPVVPFEALAEPVNAGVGAEIKPFKPQSEWIPVNAPCKVGDKLQITAAELVPCTVHPYVAVTVMFADFVATPQYHSVIGTHTAAGAAAQEYKMTSPIAIVGGSWIKSIYGLVAEVTPASGKGCIYKYRLSSTNLKHEGGKASMGDIEFAGEFIPAMLSAGPTDCAKGARLTKMKDLDIPLGSPCTIDCYLNVAVAFNAAGYFNVQILYV